MSNILFLATYPFTDPKHGGQIRCAEIVKYLSSKGHKVYTLILRSEEEYTNDDKHDFEFVFPVSSSLRLIDGHNIPFMNDYSSGEFAYSIKDRIKESLLNYSIDAIHCEQPWLFKIALFLKHNLLTNSIKLIFGSQNIESDLKGKILDAANVSSHDVELAVSKIRYLEEYAIQNADVILAVSEYDYNYFSNNLGSSGNKELLLIPNGIDRNRFNNSDLSVLDNIPEKYFVFVASGHPPNMTGFGEIFKNSLAFLPIDFPIVVIGSVCYLFESNTEYNNWKGINEHRLLKLGMLSTEQMNAVILNSNGVVIPITEGGGSNLKTAEALFSNCPVVATQKAFIGYEEFISSDGVSVVSSSDEFIDKMRELMNFNVKLRYQRQNLDLLTWDNIVSKYSDLLLGVPE